MPYWPLDSWRKLVALWVLPSSSHWQIQNFGSLPKWMRLFHTWQVANIYACLIATMKLSRTSLPQGKIRQLGFPAMCCDSNTAATWAFGAGAKTQTGIWKGNLHVCIWAWEFHNIFSFGKCFEASHISVLGKRALGKHLFILIGPRLIRLIVFFFEFHLGSRNFSNSPENVRARMRKKTKNLRKKTKKSRKNAQECARIFDAFGG